jgi:hypothetical protein
MYNDLHITKQKLSNLSTNKSQRPPGRAAYPTSLVEPIVLQGDKLYVTQIFRNG